MERAIFALFALVIVGAVSGMTTLLLLRKPAPRTFDATVYDCAQVGVQYICVRKD